MSSSCKLMSVPSSFSHDSRSFKDFPHRSWVIGAWQASMWGLSLRLVGHLGHCTMDQNFHLCIFSQLQSGQICILRPIIDSWLVVLASPFQSIPSQSFSRSPVTIGIFWPNMFVFVGHSCGHVLNWQSFSQPNICQCNTLLDSMEYEILLGPGWMFPVYSTWVHRLWCLTKHLW